jgi:phospholipid transport system substrate-binding protein
VGRLHGGTIALVTTVITSGRCGRKGKWIMTKGLVLMALASLLMTSAPVGAGAPLDKVQTAVASAVEILSRPDLEGPANLRVRRTLIRYVADDLFDFREMAQRALGRHSALPSEAERSEFLALFTDLLERCYMTTIDNYSGEKIVFLGESVQGDYATVRSKIVTTRRAEITVDYRLYRTADGWSAFDVALENISLVANYRQQFDRIIRTTSFSGLLERMRAGQVAAVTVPAGAGRPD